MQHLKAVVGACVRELMAALAISAFSRLSTGSLVAILIGGGVVLLAVATCILLAIYKLQRTAARKNAVWRGVPDRQTDFSFKVDPAGIEIELSEDSSAEVSSSHRGTRRIVDIRMQE